MATIRCSPYMALLAWACTMKVMTYVLRPLMR